jgi:hypothetical protein
VNVSKSLPLLAMLLCSEIMWICGLWLTSLCLWPVLMWKIHVYEMPVRSTLCSSHIWASTYMYDVILFLPLAVLKRNCNRWCYIFCHCRSSAYFFLFNLILLHTLVYGHLKVGYLACGDATLMVQIAIRFNTTSVYFEWNQKTISEPGDSLNLS